MTDGERFDELYRAIYRSAVRRLRDRRDRLSPESRVVLDGLAETGPLTIGELAAHFGRAQSTVTEMVAGLERQDLLARMADPRDRRRTLVWITETGFARLKLEREVLDVTRIEYALAEWPAEDRETLLRLVERLALALSNQKEIEG